MKPSLKWLAQHHLNLKIQIRDPKPGTGKPEGHDPTEDARTAIKLVKKKVQRGREFGKVIVEEGRERYVSVFEVLRDSAGGEGGEERKKGVYVGSGGGVWGKGADVVLECENDSEVRRRGPLLRIRTLKVKLTND